MSKMSQIDRAIQVLLDKLEGIRIQHVNEQAKFEASSDAMSDAIDVLRKQQKPKAAKRPAKGPKPEAVA